MGSTESKFPPTVKLLEDTIHRELTKSQTIAVIGQHGGGKSSFINTAITVLSGEYHECAVVGNFHEQGKRVTHRLMRYPKEKYLKSNGDKLEHFYPTFLDVPGFQNTNNNTVRKSLKRIFEGHIQEGTIFLEGGSSQRSCLSNQNKTNTKVDKIIFVASAKSRELPKDLIEAVISEATESSRDIPVFGVLTHADEIRPDSQEFIDFEKIFKGCLGISSMRYLLCTNYHTNAPMTRNQNSNVDVTVVKFLQQVLDPARKVYEEEMSLTTRIYNQMNLKLKTLAVFCLQVILITIYLVIMMRPHSEISEICSVRSDHDLNNDFLDHLCQMNSEWQIMKTPSLIFLVLFSVFVKYAPRKLLELFLSGKSDLKAIFNEGILTLIKRQI